MHYQAGMQRVSCLLAINPGTLSGNSVRQWPIGCVAMAICTCLHHHQTLSRVWWRSNMRHSYPTRGYRINTAPTSVSVKDPQSQFRPTLSERVAVGDIRDIAREDQTRCIVAWRWPRCPIVYQDLYAAKYVLWQDFFREMAPPNLDPMLTSIQRHLANGAGADFSAMVSAGNIISPLLFR